MLRQTKVVGEMRLETNTRSKDDKCQRFCSKHSQMLLRSIVFFLYQGATVQSLLFFLLLDLLSKIDDFIKFAKLNYKTFKIYSY